MDLKPLIREVPDWPKPGIQFKDITPLLANPPAMAATIGGLHRLVLPFAAQVVAGIESRGFIFAPLLARELGLGFVPLRKPGKLPWRKRSVEYQLEYGTDRIEIHEDALRPGQRVLVVDDVLATGGTASAAVRLCTGLGAEVVGAAFVIELAFLGGAAKLGCPVASLLKY